jgi:hypothetical protein
MGQSKHCKSGGHWSGKSYRRYQNCYKEHDENEANSIFEIIRGKIYFAYQVAWNIRNGFGTVLGPEVTEETLALARENLCL